MRQVIEVPHPFPYQGSKRALAARIVEHFPERLGTLYEPFAGSAAVSLYAAAHGRARRHVLGDANVPLAELWQAIVAEPEALSRRYGAVWEGQFAEGSDEGTHFEETRAAFNRDPRPEQMLYLLNRCVKAAVRYNAQGEFNQSRDKRRSGTKPERVRAGLLAASRLLAGKTEVRPGDFRQTVADAGRDDLLYLDPPYQGTSGARDSRYIGGLDRAAFVEALQDFNARGLSYIVSYDGRTGERRYGEPLPEALGLRHMELHAGRSSQSTLLGGVEETYESLYVSPALLARLRRVEELAAMVPG